MGPFSFEFPVHRPGRHSRILVRNSQKDVGTLCVRRVLIVVCIPSQNIDDLSPLRTEAFRMLIPFRYSPTAKRTKSYRRAQARDGGSNLLSTSAVASTPSLNVIPWWSGRACSQRRRYRCWLKHAPSTNRTDLRSLIGQSGLVAWRSRYCQIEDSARVHPVAYAETNCQIWLPTFASSFRKRRLVSIRRDVCGIRAPALTAEARARLDGRTGSTADTRPPSVNHAKHSAFDLRTDPAR